MSLASAIEKNVYMKLVEVQSKLKAPKSQFNKFGNYAYRNCEDILEALKPLLSEVKAIVNISDDVVLVGERYYIRATATFVDVETGEAVSNNAYAREELAKKGMDGSQITGTASSYARKYALNGLLDIDDTKDADTDEYRKQIDKKSKVEISEEQQDRLDLEKKCKELGIDLEEESIKNYIKSNLLKLTGKNELDEKFNLGQYNNILVKLIQRKEGNK